MSPRASASTNRLVFQRPVVLGGLDDVKSEAIFDRACWVEELCLDVKPYVARSEVVNADARVSPTVSSTLSNSRPRPDVLRPDRSSGLGSSHGKSFQSCALTLVELIQPHNGRRTGAGNRHALQRFASVCLNLAGAENAADPPAMICRASIRRLAHGPNSWVEGAADADRDHHRENQPGSRSAHGARRPVRGRSFQPRDTCCDWRSPMRSKPRGEPGRACCLNRMAFIRPASDRGQQARQVESHRGRPPALRSSHPCHCDREGQLIGQEILEHLRYRGTVRRALFDRPGPQVAAAGLRAQAKPRAAPAL